MASVEWLKEWAAKLEREFDMTPTVEKNVEQFIGLGGVRLVSERVCEFPVGIAGAHTTIKFQEIAGAMPGLTDKRT